jgi:hypothetical protein
MKKFFRASASILFCIGSFNAIAQDELGDFLKGNVKDGEALIGGYVSPALKAISSGLNQGWYNSGKPHKSFGVDLTITVNAMMIPDDEIWYNPSALLGEDSNIEHDPSSPHYPLAPTLFGPTGDGNRPHYNVVQNDAVVSGFYGSAGLLDIKKEIGNTIVPVPMANLGIGLIKGTDVRFRFIPEIDMGDGGMKLFGLGVMHDVKQWIPGIKNMPFDLSGFVGFTKMDFNVDIENEEDLEQSAELSMSATTIQGIISKKISVLTLYGGAGYNIARSKLAMKGTYDLDSDASTTADQVKDPFTVKTAASGPRVTAGFRLKLAVFTLHADYTLQKYSCFTAGFGIWVR